MDNRPIALLHLLEEKNIRTSTARSVDAVVGSLLNSPYFETGSRDRQVERLVMSGWREFASIPRYGPAPKKYLDRLLRLADRWWVLSGSNAPNTAEAALLRYNASMIVVQVAKAVDTENRR